MKVIDSHIHVQPWNTLKPKVFDMFIKSRPDANTLMEIMDSPSKLLRYLDSQEVEKTVIINYPSQNVMGFTEQVNEFILHYTKKNRNRLLPCGGIIYKESPTSLKKKTINLIKRGMKAFKIQTAHQFCYPNDYLSNKSMRSFLEVLENNGIPLIIHTGTSIFPGARNKYSDPIYIDDTAVDFPNLKIVIAHLGRPLWMQTSLFLLRRHKNVYGDISSIPPKNLLAYFPRLSEFADKLFFGSDWPAPGVPDIKKNISEFMDLNLPEDSKLNILCKNALKVFEW